jgi:hypothetical protein
MATAEQPAPPPAILYVDTSALLKLLVREAESAAIERELLTWKELADRVPSPIVALHGRYPTQLEALKDKWRKDDSQTETLCALAAWRAELDDAGQDPRDEPAFQSQLADYAELLRRQGGVTAWKPGAPPAEWAAG